MPNEVMNRRSGFLVFFAVPGDINSRTGGYGYDRELIKELNARGIDVELLQLSDAFPTPDSAALAETAALLSSLPNDSLVIIDGLAFAVMGEIAVREATRLKLIALCHHPLALETGVSKDDSVRLALSETRALAAARAVVVTSAVTEQILAQNYGVSEAKITVARPGTARSVFASADNEVPQLLTLATLTPRKGHDLLINSLAQLNHLPWQARFVGGAEFDPAWANHLQRLVREKNLQSRIHFAGNSEHVEQELLNADVFVLPSHFEGYGMAFAEAISFGLPVIATRVGAAAELIPPDSGILISPGDQEALTHALNTVLIDPERRTLLKAGARRAAHALPTWRDCANRVANLLFSLRTP